MYLLFCNYFLFLSAEFSFCKNCVTVHDKHSNSRSVPVSGSCGMVMGGGAGGGGGIAVGGMVGTPGACGGVVPVSGITSLRDKIIASGVTSGCTNINRSNNNNTTVIGGDKRIVTSTAGSDIQVASYWQPVVVHRQLQPHDSVHDSCMYLSICFLIYLTLHALSKVLSFFNSFILSSFTVCYMFYSFDVQIISVYTQYFSSKIP